MEDNTPDKFYRGISSADAISAEGYITEAVRAASSRPCGAASLTAS